LSVACQSICARKIGAEKVLKNQLQHSLSLLPASLGS
jgi:hypothetical protein